MKRYTIRDPKTKESMDGLKNITGDSAAFSFLRSLTNKHDGVVSLDSLRVGETANAAFQIGEVVLSAEVVRVK